MIPTDWWNRLYRMNEYEIVWWFNGMMWTLAYYLTSYWLFRFVRLQKEIPLDTDIAAEAIKADIAKEESSNYNLAKFLIRCFFFTFLSECWWKTSVLDIFFKRALRWLRMERIVPSIYFNCTLKPHFPWCPRMWTLDLKSGKIDLQQIWPKIRKHFKDKNTIFK